MTTGKELFDHRPKGLNRLPENPETSQGASGRFPSWLHRKLPRGGQLSNTRAILKRKQLNTVCEEAKCPNRLECYDRGTATFLALGKACTRACGFCDIDFAAAPSSPEPDEPERIAEVTAELNLRHVVITMVARDDLSDQGATHIAKIIDAVRKRCPTTSLEVLVSDFSGDVKALDIVLDKKPEIFNHNIETVRRLSPRVRHKASYERSLKVLSYAQQSGKTSFVKSGIMVGLGETENEVYETMQDLKNAGCEIITIGQYLQANRKKLRVKSFVTPEQFKRYEAFGGEMGLKYVYSAPFVRSSYNAALLKDNAFKGDV